MTPLAKPSSLVATFDGQVAVMARRPPCPLMWLVPVGGLDSLKMDLRREFLW